MRRVGAVCAVCVLGLAAPGLARAVDLRTARVRGPSYSHPGGAFAAFGTVTAAGGRAGSSTLRFYLSKDRVRNVGDVRVGSHAVPSLARGHSFAAATRAHVPASAAPRSYYVLACADDLHRVRESNEHNNCAASAHIVEVTPQAVTSRQLIDAAASDGTITAEAALLDRVYAVFDDSRLPTAFQGDEDANMTDDSVMRDAMAAWPTLSAGTQDALAPFFEPPVVRGSWADPVSSPTARPFSARTARDSPCDVDQLDNPNWTSIRAAGGKVRIWWWKGNEGDHQFALFVQRAVGDAYPKFKDLLGREPISDDGVLCFNGGDGALDIYLVQKVTGKKSNLFGLTTPYPPWCSNTPAFITISARFTWVALHELFHAFQYSFPYSGPCTEYEVFDEGLATWGADYADRLDDWEHYWATTLYCSYFPLDYGVWGGYESWPFFLYLEKTQGPSVIRSIYQQFATKLPKPAIDAAIPGGFAERWPDFTRYGWNDYPFKPSFAEWDRFPPKPGDCRGNPREPRQLDLGGVHEKSFPVWVGDTQRSAWDPALRSLSRWYSILNVVDSDIRYLKFKNTVAGDPKASVQAVVTFADGHQDVQDWSDQSKVEYCFDDVEGPQDDVTDVIVMFANVDLDDEISPSEEPTVKIRDACETFDYKILSADWSAHAELTPGLDVCAQFAGITSSGFSDLAGTSGGVTQPVPLASRLSKTKYDGVDHVQGEISAKTTWTYDITRHGCMFDLATESFVPCVRHDHETATPAAFDVFSVYFQPWSANLNGAWSVPSPEVGFSSGDDSGGDNPNCLVPNDSFVWQGSETDQEQPLTKFTASGPQTITFTGSKTFSRVEYTGETTTMTYDWTYTITFQRVDEDGNPV